MAPHRLTYRIAGRRFSFFSSPLLSLFACFLLAGCVGNSIPTETEQSYQNTLSPTDPNKMRMVDCLLPGRVYQLGSQAAFISPRRPQKIAAGLCEIRGGEYVAYDRADLETSLRVWLVEAEMGNANAQTYVGEMYEQGLGATPNPEKAAKWYRKAADQGFARAQMNLGYLYEKGLGVPMDKVAALTWYRKATGLSQDSLQLASQSAPLQEELEESQKYSEELKKRLTMMESQLNARKRELESTRKKIMRQKKVTLKPEPEIEQQEIKLTALKKELDKREQVLNERQLQISGEHDQLRQRANQAQRDYETLKIEMQAAKNHEVELQAQLASQKEAAGDLQQQLSDLQQKLQLKQQDLENAEVDLKEFRADLAQHLRQPAAPENEKELSRLKELVAQREIQVNEMHKAFDKFSTETTLERNALAHQLESAKKEETAMRNLMTQHMAESNNYQKRLKETEEALQSARVDLKGQSEDLGNLNEQLELTQKEAREKQHQLELYISKTGILESEHNKDSEKLTAEIESLKKRIEELKAEVASNVQPEEPPIPGDLFAPEEFGDYYALIISNSDYTQLDSLPTAKEDAKAVKRILKEDYGFSTKVLQDATLGDVLVELLHMKEKLTENDKLLIYYTGHGYLDKEGNGWWQLMGASSNNKERKNWLDDKEIAEQLDSIKARHILIVADSCYSTQWTAHSDLRVSKPPEKYGDRNILKKWIRRMLNIETRMVLTSGQLKPITSSKESKNSIFTAAFLDTLQKNRPVLEGSRLAYEIYQSVGTTEKNLGLKGTPTYDSIHPSVHRGGEFFFRRTQSLHADAKPNILSGGMPLAMQ